MTQGASFEDQSSSVSRRRVLQGLALGAGAVAASPLLAACGSTSDSTAASASGSSSAAGGGAVSFGSNASDAVPKKAYADVFAAFTKSLGHDGQREHGRPQHVPGADQHVSAGLAGPGVHVVLRLPHAVLRRPGPVHRRQLGVGQFGSEYNDSFKGASTGNDGKQYFVPFYYYPWALFYRKSVFKELGLDPTKITIDELKSAAATMKAKGLIPIAFADKDGWPAMGTFDYINVRTNGYDFHVSLMAGKESWTDPKVKAVFANWADLLPLHQEGALGRTWQEPRRRCSTRRPACTCSACSSASSSPRADRDDLDFFPFPQIEAAYGQDTVEAPIDGFMLSKRTENSRGARRCWSTSAGPEAQGIYLASDPNNVGTNNETDTSKYNALQKKAAELVGGAKHITQFLDRDTRPDFASTVMIPSIQKFIAKPSDIDSILDSVEQQKQAIFTS